MHVDQGGPRGRPSLVWVNQFAVLPSDGGGTRHFELGRELVRLGWNVTIVASDLHLQRRTYTRRAGESVREMVEETVDGVRMRWLWAAPYKGNDWRRGLNWLSFHRSVAAMPELPSAPTVVIGSSPQLFAATAARKLARRWRVPFVLEVRDLWPESLLAAGGRKGLFYFALTRVASGLYRDADRIMVLAAGTAGYLVDRGIDAGHIFHIPNGVDVNVVQPGSAPARSEAAPVFVYAGAHGPANGLDVVLDAAATLAASGVPAKFILIGDGPAKGDLVAAAAARRLPNVEFRNPVAKNELAGLLARADAGLMLLRDAALFAFAVSPNKLFDYLSAGIPVLCNVPGEVADLLAESGGGLQASDASAPALVNAIKRFHALSPGDRQRLGRSGRQWVERHHSREVLGAKLDAALRAIIAPQ